MNTELCVSSPRESYPTGVSWKETDNAAEQVKALPPVSEKPLPGGPEGLPAFVAAGVVTTPPPERMPARKLSTTIRLRDRCNSPTS